MRPKRSLIHRAVPGLVACALAATVASAHAGEPEQKAMAQTLFEQARDLIKERKFADACPKLAQSLRLDPGTGTMLWLADCWENTAQTASAWAQFKEAAAAAALQNDPREKVARRRAADLEPRLTKLVIVVQAQAKIPGLEVRRDGAVVADIEVGLASPVDPGKHTISATATGHTPWSVEIDVPARPETVRVEVPTLAPTAPIVAAVLAPSTAIASEPPSSAAAGSSSWTTLRVSGVVVASAGVVAVGTGAFLGLSAKSTYDASNRDGHCSPTNECDAAGKEHRAAASGLATGATVAFSAGIAGLAGAAILYFLSPRSVPSTAVVPVVSAREAGVFVQHVF